VGRGGGTHYGVGAGADRLLAGYIWVQGLWGIRSGRELSIWGAVWMVVDGLMVVVGRQREALIDRYRGGKDLRRVALHPTRQSLTLHHSNIRGI